MIKKFLFSICILFLCFNQLIFAQKEESNVIICEDFHITRPLIEINAEFPVNNRKIEREMKKKMKKKIVESKDKKHRDPQHFEFSFEKDGYEYGTDSTIIQKNDGSRPGPTQKINIAGQSSSSRPMDPSGAAGNDYYVQIINATVYKIYNKTTGAVLTTGTLGNLWSPATGNSGDPIVMYDRFADRWFMAQFGTTGNKIYIAVSTTSDPAGSYYTYTFTSPQFPDYLKFSIWQDGYYMTSNQSTKKVFAFERDAMLIGNPAARSIYKTFTPPSGGGFFCSMAGDSDGNTGLAPAGTPCPIFSYSDNAWGGSVIDGIQIYQMAVNWVPTTPTATLSFVSAVPTASFDGSYNSSWNDVSQPGTTQKLDGIGGTLSYRAQWRKWATYNSVVLAWPIKISTTQRSIMWCELRQDQTTMAWTTFQQGVFTPDAYTRWLASIAMDDNGNIGLCYLKSGATTIYPSLGYTGRLASDPLNTMTYAETIAAVGTASQTGLNRVGDYSQTTLDPDGSTFWHTGEYMGGTSTSPARTRIYSFQLILPTAALVSVTSSDSDNSICAGTEVTFTASPTNGGTNPSYQWYVNNSPVGSNSSTFTTSSLVNGSVVSCIMTSDLSGAETNPATSNTITVSVVNPVTPSVNIFGNQAICAGQSITLGSFSSNSGSSPAYQWLVNGVNVGTNISSYSFVPNNGDVVSLVLTSNSTCVTSSTANASPVNVTVNPLPSTPSISQNINTLTSSSATGNQWYYNGTLISGATSQNYTASLVGIYTVLVSNPQGCSASSVGITVNEFLDIVELDSYIFTIFPNPSQGDFSISFTAFSGTNYTIKIYNAAGQLIYEDELANQNQSGKIIKDIHLGELASGVYNLLLSDGKTESSKKIIIKRN